MSNIVVHKTSQLDLSTSFTNNFLDGLLTQYCEGKYVENTVIADGVPNISLDDLVKFAYPGYYRKSPGLYGQISSTHVIVVYDENLHNVLQEALAHKLSRLFVAYQPQDIPTISFEYRTRSTSSFHDRFGIHEERLSRDFSKSYKQIYNLSLLEDYCRKALRGMRMDDLEMDQMKTPYNLVTAPAEGFVIYKPNVDAIKNVNQTVINKNIAVIDSSFFYRDSRDTVVNAYWLAIHINMGSNLSRILRSAVSQEYYSEMIARADVVLKQQLPVMQTYITGLRQAKDLREKIEREEAQRKAEAARQRHVAAETYKQQHTCPDTVENLKEINIKDEPELKHKIPEEDNFIGVLILIIVVSFILGIIIF